MSRRDVRRVSLFDLRAVPRCSALAVPANFTTIVYGVSIEETARPEKPCIRVSNADLVGKSPTMIEIIDGILQTECRALYR
jgi:hypothetical protein